MYIFTVIIAAIGIAHLCLADILKNQNEETNVGLTEGIRVKLSPQSPLEEDGAKYYNFPINTPYRPLPNRKCPLCDASVYPYCGEKLLHDACCCTDPYVHHLPYQCKLADCRFLHANNCREHRLIANCCCSDDYRSLLKGFSGN